MDKVILVDANDQTIGVADKLAAHEQGLLHRAFSVFVVRLHQQQLEILLQQRQLSKYHGGGLWTNTCCSHPQPEETVLMAGKRRLQEELGFSVELAEISVFTYRAEFSNGLVEHEIDHVLIGEFNPSIQIKPNTDEVMATRWISVEAAIAEYQSNPSYYTPWFLQALDIVKKHYS